MREARVLDRGRKGDECEGGAAIGEVGEEELKAGCEGERFAEASEALEWLREVIGAIKFCKLGFEAFGDSKARGTVRSSEGISSAAGIGRPRPAATN